MWGASVVGTCLAIAAVLPLACSTTPASTEGTDGGPARPGETPSPPSDDASTDTCVPKAVAQRISYYPRNMFLRRCSAGQITEYVFTCIVGTDVSKCNAFRVDNESCTSCIETTAGTPEEEGIGAVSPFFRSERTERPSDQCNGTPAG